MCSSLIISRRRNMVDDSGDMSHPAACLGAVVVEVDAVPGAAEQHSDQHDGRAVGPHRTAAVAHQDEHGDEEEHPQHDVVEELLRGDRHEDEAVRHVLAAQGVVAHDPAADAAGREDVADGQAAEGDAHHLAQAHANGEHVQQVAEEVGVADQGHDLEEQCAREQGPVGVAHQVERFASADEPGEQKVESEDDDDEEDDSTQGLYRSPPPAAGVVGRLRRIP